jgi:hypothetical protein
VVGVCGELGVGLLDRLGEPLAPGVLGQCAVDAGHARVVALAFAGGDDQIGWMSSTDSPFARRCGSWALIWRHVSSAASNFGRART